MKTARVKIGGVCCRSSRLAGCIVNTRNKPNIVSSLKANIVPPAAPLDVPAMTANRLRPANRL